MDIQRYIIDMWNLALAGETQGIFFWASVYTFVLLSYSFVYQRRVAGWPSTMGTLVQAGVRKFGATEWATSNQDYVVSALYHYSVNGKDYQGKRVSPWVVVASHNAKFLLEKQLEAAQVHPGGRVRVYYKPGNPKKSFLVRPGMVGAAFTIAIAVLPAALYVAKYHS